MTIRENQNITPSKRESIKWKYLETTIKLRFNTKIPNKDFQPLQKNTGKTHTTVTTGEHSALKPKDATSLLSQDRLLRAIDGTNELRLRGVSRVKVGVPDEVSIRDVHQEWRSHMTEALVWVGDAIASFSVALPHERFESCCILQRSQRVWVIAPLSINWTS